jgi:hypothetical protein
MVLRGKTEVFGGKPVTVPLCPPQFPSDLAWDRLRASAVTILNIFQVLNISRPAAMLQYGHESNKCK